MTNRITDLPDATLPLSGDEMVPVVQSGETRKAPINAVLLGETPALRWGSVRYHPEHGENRNGRNGGLYFPNTPNLLRTSSAGDTPIFASAGAVAIRVSVPKEAYDGIRRSPTLFGNDRISAATINRRLDIGYVTGADSGNTVNAGRFRARIAGEAAGGVVDIYSADLPSDFSYECIIIVRFDGSDFGIDVVDCANGTLTAGPRTAKPSSWAGIIALTGNLGIGISVISNYPTDHRNLFGHQNIHYARGQCAGALILETDGSDSEWQQFALGADPMALWSGGVRAWAPLVDGQGSRDNTVYTNLATPTIYDDDLAQLGEVLPGSNIARQSVLEYLKPQRLPDPALVNLKAGRFGDYVWISSVGELTLPVSMAGQIDGEAIEAQIVSPAGAVEKGWDRVGEAVASGSVTLRLFLTRGIWRINLRTRITGTRASINSDVSCGLGVLVNAQSQADYALSVGMSELGADTTLNERWDGAHADRCFVACVGPVSSLVLRKPALFRAAEKPGIFGNGLIRYFNTIAKAWDGPIHLYDTAVSGTTLADTLANNDAGGVRAMQDIYDIVDLSAGRLANGRSVISLWDQMWHSSGSITAYAEAFMPAMIYGKTTAQVPVVDDYFFSGERIEPSFVFQHHEPNRIIAPSSASISDSRTEHLTRKNLRDNASVFGYVQGAPLDVHRLQGNTFTHPALNEANGAPLVAEWLAKSHLYALGLGGWKGPVAIETVRFTDGSRETIEISFAGPIGFSLATHGGGSTISGFEVNNSKDGFAAAITGARTVTLTKTSGSWSQGDIIEHKPGGPGSYGSGFDEAAYMAGALINEQDRCLVQGSGGDIVIAAPA